MGLNPCRYRTSMHVMVIGELVILRIIDVSMRRQRSCPVGAKMIGSRDCVDRKLHFGCLDGSILRHASHLINTNHFRLMRALFFHGRSENRSVVTIFRGGSDSRDILWRINSDGHVSPRTIEFAIGRVVTNRVLAAQVAGNSFADLFNLAEGFWKIGSTAGRHRESLKNLFRLVGWRFLEQASTVVIFIQ
jgi:hypothetical protein